MSTHTPIGIIGLSCRFPDAPNIEAFRENLIFNHDAINELSLEDIEREGINPSLYDEDNFINAGTLIKDAANFDYAFFGLSPKEAELMDPQHRLFLEECRKLLDTTNLTRGEQNIGVFAGCRQSTYQFLLEKIKPENITNTETFQQLLGNDKDYLATKVAYHLNLNGPAMSLQTACSTSLVAIHQACQSLRNRECESALAGGAAISFPQGVGYRVSDGMIFSNDGKCRPFSAEGTGIVAGNGLGVIALKRLDDAIRDNDQIHAVIRGSGLSNDGKAKLGFTAPGKFGQQKAIQSALENSGVDPKDIGLLEAHGTGTPMGDPIEVQAISEIYQNLGVSNQNCAIGSVKGNVGHLDTAAGVASLIKSVLAVRDGLIFPTVHCRPENPIIGFGSTPFYLADECEVWPKRFKSRIAAVSSFGIGGTNCHMLVEQPPEQKIPTSTKKNNVEIVAISNHHEDNVLKQAENYIAAIEPNKIQAQCKTVALKRQHYSSRIALYGKNKQEIKQQLASVRVRTIKANPKIAWVFSGQGSQKSGMGEALYQAHPVFKEAIDECVTLFSEQGISNIKEVMFDNKQKKELNKTLYTQPVLFSWQYAMAMLLKHWGIEPNMVAGHSIGEFAASVIANHLSINTVIRLVAYRAQLMQEKSAAGGMLALQMSQEQLDKLLEEHKSISLASINGKQRFTLSGRNESIKALKNELDKSNITYKLLDVNRAFHSTTMEAIKSDFYDFSFLEEKQPNPSKSTSMYSSLTAKKVEKGDLNIDYWFQQLRQPVQFYQTIQSIASEEPDLVIEIGPDGSFLSLLKHSNLFDQNCEMSTASHASLPALISELYCLGYEAALEEHYTKSAQPFVEMPPLVYSDYKCWPAPRDDENDYTHANTSNKATGEQIEFWKWQWEKLATVYQQNLHQSNHVNTQHCCIIGNNSFSTELQKHIISLGHECDLIEVPPVGKYDRLIDTRLLTSKWALKESINDLMTAKDNLLALSEYAESYPDCHLITLISNTPSHVDEASLNANPHESSWPYINICRNLVNEKPHLQLCCLDINDNKIDRDTAVLLSQLNELNTVLRWQDNYLYSLNIVTQEVKKPKTVIDWKSEHFTLIAGLGSVGIGLAKWLAEQSCDKLVFLIRRTANEQQQSLIHALTAQGVTIHVLQASLLEEQELEAGFNTLDITINNVFHTAHAGTYKLHPLNDNDAFMSSLPVKIAGSMNLYQNVKNQPLNMFCMFSSLSSMMSISGTSGYAIANAWQDAYAEYLRLQDIPALTISWSQLQLSRGEEYVSSVDDTGIKPLSAQQAFTAMEQLISNDQSAITPIIYDSAVLGRVIDRLPATSIYFKTIFDVDKKVNAEKTNKNNDVVINLKNLDDEQKERAVSDFIRVLICERLKYDHDQLSLQTPLTEQGVDSLVFLDLVQTINQKLKLDLEVTVAYEYNTVDALSSHISDLIGQEYSNEITSPEVNAEQQLSITSSSVENNNKPFPLTSLQQAYWIGRSEGLDLGSVSCHEYIELEFEDLDYKKLETAWNRLIQRHEMMRCIILPNGENQILEDVDYYQVQYLDLATLTSAEREQKLHSIRERMSYQVFNPQQWPSFELSVSQVSERTSRVHLDLDFIFFDVQSMRTIYSELAILLEDDSQQLEPLGYSFKDYVLEKVEFEKTDKWNQARQYWLNQLESIPNAPDLPVIQAENKETSAQYTILKHRLPPSLWSKFSKHANKFGFTPTSALLTAYSQALNLYSNSSEFTINLTYFNRKRSHEQIMSICGDFSSLILLPIKNQATESFLDKTKRIQDKLWESIKYADYDGVKVMRELGRIRNVGAHEVQMPVVFTSMLGMNFDEQSSIFSKQVFEINLTPQVWIDYQVSEYEGALLSRWFVAENLFESHIIKGIFSAFTAIIESLAKDESLWKHKDAYLDLIYQNNNQTDLKPKDPDASMILPALESLSSYGRITDMWLEKLPQVLTKPALKTQSSVITHQQLAERVSGLCAKLKEAGVNHDDTVCIAIPKSIEQVVSCLAISIIGATYVPIDIEQSNERIGKIITELQPSLILFDNYDFDEKFNAIPQIRVAEVAPQDFEHVLNYPKAEKDSLAYIIYTSGSTGIPKGVCINHRAAINTCLDINQRFSVTENDCVLALSALHFDLSVYDIFGVLGQGGSIALPSYEEVYNPIHWYDLCDKYNVTVWNSVPALWSLLIETIKSSEKSLPIRLTMLSGDWIPLNLASETKGLFPELDFYSLGGATEASIWSIYYPINDINSSWKSIPYGKALSGQQVLVLDSNLKTVLSGQIGDIYIAGIGLSTGYYNDPDKTQQHFFKHPRTGIDLYKTGDLGSYFPDGNIEFKGRSDNQVKINGYRVELGEIETVLNQHPEIQETCIIYAGQPKKQLQSFITKSAHHSQPVKNTSWLEVNKVADKTSKKLPEGFDVEQYAARLEKIEQLSTWVMLATIQSVNLLVLPQQSTTVSEITAALNVSPNFQKILLSWINVLIDDGFISIDDNEQLCATKKVVEIQKSPLLREQISLEVEQNGISAEQRLWSFYSRCIDKVDQLLTGEFNPLSLMFEDGKTDFAESHYRENIFSQHFNNIAGKTAKVILQGKSQSTKIKILEFGAGIGSVTHDILKNIPNKNFSYDFTDISPYFLDNAKEMFSDWPQIRYRHFNINHEPGLQQFELGSYDVIIGANVLHDAINVHASIAYLRSLLKPDGYLMLVEGTTNPRFQMVSLGFVEGLTHYQDERVETSLPMISAPLWKQHLIKAGFGESAAFPPETRWSETLRQHVIVAQNNGENTYLDTLELASWLKNHLPEYMIPLTWNHITKIPLTSNGKINRTVMEEVTINNVIDYQQSTKTLQSENAKLLAKIWEKVLNTQVTSEDANFFSVGGDSLLMTRLSTEIQQCFQVNIDLVSLLRQPVLIEQLDLIESSIYENDPNMKVKPEEKIIFEEFEEGVI